MTWCQSTRRNVCVVVFLLESLQVRICSEAISWSGEEGDSALISIILSMIFNLSGCDGCVGRDVVKNAPFTSCLNLKLPALFIGTGFSHLRDSVAGSCQFR